jgi:hypothetical protein
MKVSLIGPIRKLRRKLSVVDTVPDSLLKIGIFTDFQSAQPNLNNNG